MSDLDVMNVEYEKFAEEDVSCSKFPRNSRTVNSFTSTIDSRRILHRLGSPSYRSIRRKSGFALLSAVTIFGRFVSGDSSPFVHSVAIMSDCVVKICSKTASAML